MNEIINAIKNHNYLEFTYEGLHRKAIPFAIGTHITTGNKTMRALQVAGSSASGKFDFPKLWTVNDMHSVRTLEEKFDIPDRYQSGDDHLNPIDAAL